MLSACWAVRDGEGKPFGNAMALYRLKGGKIVDDWYCMTRLEEQ